MPQPTPYQRQHSFTFEATTLAPGAAATTNVYDSFSLKRTA